MSRTMAGYLFQCKTCGGPHILTFSEPYDGIRVCCANDENKVRSYDKVDFEYYHGWANPFVGMAKEANTD